MSDEARVVRYHADALDVIPTLADESVDAVVTDPPYGLEFMGREWDTFSGQRKAGIRGGDGAKGILPGYGRGGSSEDRFVFRQRSSRAFYDFSARWAAECLRVLKPGGHLLAFGGTRTSHRLAVAVEDAGFEIRDSIVWIYGSGFPKSLDVSKAIDKADKPDDAKRWAGWGTALKPAHEPIVVARKPLIGTVAANVLAHGTGALNIDACRVATDDDLGRTSTTALGVMNDDGWRPKPQQSQSHDAGRWPANVVLDEGAAAELDEQSGTLKSGANPTRRGSDKFRDAYGDFAGQEECIPARGVDTGGASRFFPVFRYQAKAPTRERVKIDGVAHPTVKPLDLMRWLVRLVTPLDGVVLEPFAGSGTTVEACILEGMRCLAIEREESYLPLIAQRIERAGLVAW